MAELRVSKDEIYADRSTRPVHDSCATRQKYTAQRIHDVLSTVVSSVGFDG